MLIGHVRVQPMQYIMHGFMLFDSLPERFGFCIQWHINFRQSFIIFFTFVVVAEATTRYKMISSSINIRFRIATVERVFF